MALEINNVEPPELAADIPVSVTILFPDKTAATLIGEPFLYGVKGRDFRVSSGCEFVPVRRIGRGAWVDAVLRAARLSENDLVVDAYSGVGVLTAFLAVRLMLWLGSTSTKTRSTMLRSTWKTPTMYH